MGRGKNKSDDRRISTLAYLSFGGLINSIEIAELLKASKGTINEDKRYLIKSGLVIKNGGRGCQSFKLTELGEKCLHYESLEFIEGV